ncbi:MAG: tRNA (adenosine(37)-N6)-threonylcarbamoyltransferase complex dimerization subunit type 1 TsaB [Gammaproteobacteria bacterium]|nr:tRNA (adenosine(37)-N6)-threonylcarbamoyltransferase complex dimerization subunit type 1 TsaB [Gammaproteobacteria bacterium]
MTTQKTKLLALDTSTEACSAALYIDGHIEQIYQLAPRVHTHLILGMVEQLLADAGIGVAQLDALAFGRGPGSFTGVRIATGVVQGLAFAAELPVVPVSTLASIAQAVYEDHQHNQVLAAIDARMGDVYWGAYRLNAEGLMLLVDDELVIPPDQLSRPEGDDWVGAGSGWQTYAESLSGSMGVDASRQFADYFPQAKTIARLAVADFAQGKGVDAAQALPVYLRNDVAKKSAQQ